MAGQSCGWALSPSPIAASALTAASKSSLTMASATLTDFSTQSFSMVPILLGFCSSKMEMMVIMRVSTKERASRDWAWRYLRASSRDSTAFPHTTAKAARSEFVRFLITTKASHVLIYENQQKNQLTGRIFIQPIRNLLPKIHHTGRGVVRAARGLPLPPWHVAGARERGEWHELILLAVAILVGGRRRATRVIAHSRAAVFTSDEAAFALLAALIGSRYLPAGSGLGSS